MKKVLMLTLILIASLIFIMPKADAYFLACFNKGDRIDFCNPAVEDRTAPNNNYQICMSSYDATRECYNQASLNACNHGLPECTTGGGSPNIDQDPPAITLVSPADEGVYNERRVLFSLSVDERSDIFFTDNVNGRGRWSRLCTNCIIYTGERSMEEGLNDITIRAEDPAGNRREVVLNFIVDTEEPKFKETTPKSGFSDGSFSAVFEELNPVFVDLHYGNNQVGMRIESLDVGSCILENKRYTCATQVDLNDYNQQGIGYYFVITDVANNVEQSKTISLLVDTVDPLINSFNYPIEGKNVMFSIDITEPNFAVVEYIDYLESSPKWKSMCTKLVSGKCEKKISFKDGDHLVDVRIKDLAGNAVVEPLSFFTDSKPPKVSGTEPKTGYANGEFSVEFTEENTQEVELHLGNTASGMDMHTLNYDSDCVLDRTKNRCIAMVNLEDYDQEEIEYWFKVVDKVGSIGESRKIKLKVDTTFPVILNPDSLFTIDESNVLFNVQIEELNFAELQYKDNSEGSPSWKRLCTRLTNGVCTKTVRFRSGGHQLDLQTFDQAGNTVGTAVNFVIP